MSKEYSPFTPGAPVPLELFIGRQKEARSIIQAVKKAIHRRSVVNLFVEGIRGIGKSSLCAYAMAGVEKETRALVTYVPLGGVHTLDDFVRTVFDAIVRTKTGSKWYDAIFKIFDKHIETVDVFGVNVRFNASQKEIDGLKADLAGAFRSFLSKFPDNIRPEGIVLMLDDINGLASQGVFANWFKSLIDGVVLNRANSSFPITFVFVGLPQRRTELIQQQQSLDRVFEVIPVSALCQEEVEKFFATAFESVDVQIEAQALKMLSRIGRQGYPVFLHEIGDAVFSLDTDNNIDVQDVLKGVMKAIDIVGKKYVGPNVLEVISSESYKNILRKLGPYWEQYPDDFGRVIRANIMRVEKDSKGLEGLDNFLRKMTKLNVIHRIEGGHSGVYEFDNVLYAYYFAFMMGGNIESSS